MVEECTLVAFTPNRIQQYLWQRFNKNIKLQWDNYCAEFCQDGTWMEIAKFPLMLHILCEVFINKIKTKSIASMPKNKVSLYEEFISIWFDRSISNNTYILKKYNETAAQLKRSYLRNMQELVLMYCHTQNYWQYISVPDKNHLDTQLDVK